MLNAIRTPLATGLAAFLALTGPAIAQEGPANISADKIDRWVSRYHDLELFNGIILVADEGEVIYQDGFGDADMEWGIANTADTRFLLGSIAKQFTAALILQLHEEGRIDLHAPIRDYLPLYPAGVGDRVTTHHLLSHTSGIPEYWGTPAFVEVARDDVQPRDFIRIFADEPLVFEPGTRFQYSNSGYYLLGLIIEEVTGKTYASVLHDRLLDPLGMTSSGYWDGTRIVSRMARPYQRVAGAYEPALYLHPSAAYAAGMMYSSAGDLFTWMNALFGGNVFRDPATLDLMLSPNRGDYGYGLQLNPMEIEGRSVSMVAHDGGINGFGTILRYFPDDDRMIIAADNTQRNVIRLANAATHLLYGVEIDIPRAPISDVLRELITSVGIDAAAERYRELWTGERDNFDFQEVHLNRLRYENLGAGETATALGIFRLNTESYPGAFNTWDSLGEALLLAGRRDEAIASYRRSIELNPDNANGVAVLERLGVEP